MVPDNTYWTWVKIGVFSGGATGLYTSLDTSDGGAGVGDYRIYYDSGAGSGLPAPVNPVGGTSYTITGSGATLRDYTFELPATLPMSDEYYYFAAWYDGDDNDILDLVDDWDWGVIPNGEYNRCATKATTNTDGDPTLITIDRFEASTITEGSYKYTGWDEAAIPYNEIEDLETSNDSGFDFQITGNSGW
jgi:hypothetical protein